MNPRILCVALVLLASASCSSDREPAAESAPPAASSSASGTPSDPDAASSPSTTPSTGEAGDCVPADVTRAGIPLVDGEPVCDLVRGSLADGDLSIVIRVASVKAGFAAASRALESAGYSAGVASPDASNWTDGTYTVLLTVAEQDPYGAVATYAISAA